MFVNVWQPKLVLCLDCGYEIFIQSDCENCDSKEDVVQVDWADLKKQIVKLANKESN